MSKKLEIFKGKGREDVSEILWILAKHGPLSPTEVQRELDKNYSIAYRTIKRLVREKLVREVYKVPPRKSGFRGKPKLSSRFGLTHKGAVATLLCFPTNDYEGLRYFVARWSEESVVLDLIHNLLPRVPKRFIHTAILVPVKKHLLYMDFLKLPTFLNIDSEEPWPTLQDIDRTVGHSLRDGIVRTVPHMLDKREVNAVLRALRQESVKTDLYLLDLLNFIGETARFVHRSTRTREQREKKFRLMLRLYRNLTPSSTMRKYITGSMLDKVSSFLEISSQRRLSKS